MNLLYFIDLNLNPITKLAQALDGVIGCISKKYYKRFELSEIVCGQCISLAEQSITGDLNLYLFRISLPLGNINFVKLMKSFRKKI